MKDDKHIERHKHALIATQVCGWEWKKSVIEILRVPVFGWCKGDTLMAMSITPFSRAHANLREAAIEEARQIGWYVETSPSERGYSASVWKDAEIVYSSADPAEIEMKYFLTKAEAELEALFFVAAQKSQK